MLLNLTFSVFNLIFPLFFFFSSCDLSPQTLFFSLFPSSLLITNTCYPPLPFHPNHIAHSPFLFLLHNTLIFFIHPFSFHSCSVFFSLPITLNSIMCPATFTFSFPAPSLPFPPFSSSSFPLCVVLLPSPPSQRPCQLAAVVVCGVQ